MTRLNQSVDEIDPRASIALLRFLALAAGLGWSVLFIIVGLWYELQAYGDGSLFSYAVAVQDAWAFHWRNISGRLFVYLFSLLPGEIYVALTGDARGGIVIYGFLHFAAPLLGLAATFAADRSQGRIIFCYACCSTASLCPLVFGFPTEMWMAHSLFWPTLAVCHHVRCGLQGVALVFVALLALAFTHEGALIFALVILLTLLLRGSSDRVFPRAAGSFLLILSIWVFVRLTIRPDAYFASILPRAALNLVNPINLTDRLGLLLFAALAAYGMLVLLLRQITPGKAQIGAVGAVAAALIVYWLWFDGAVHAENRYYMRTALLIGTPILGALAAAYALRADGQLKRQVPFLPRLLTVLAQSVSARLATGGLLLLVLVHTAETTKFVAAWAHYRRAVQALAMGTASDPALGDRHFVSSDRISAKLNQLSWFSTTHFLSVLVAPGYMPTRLVIDPSSSYFWLACETARANEQADRAVPTKSRRLVRVHACLHRGDGRDQGH